jgi:hypothetical protein
MGDRSGWTSRRYDSSKPAGTALTPKVETRTRPTCGACPNLTPAPFLCSKRIDPVGCQKIQRFPVKCSEHVGRMRLPTANVAQGQSRSPPEPKSFSRSNFRRACDNGGCQTAMSDTVRNQRVSRRIVGAVPGARRGDAFVGSKRIYEAIRRPRRWWLDGTESRNDGVRSATRAG